MGIGRKGFVTLEFDRDGATQRDAITSAERDVVRAIHGSELVEVAEGGLGLAGLKAAGSSE